MSKVEKAPIDLAAVTKVAQLARLKLTDEEMTKITEQLRAVLANFDELQEVDTEGVEPLISPTEMSVIWREDKIDQHCQIEEIMTNAPSRSGNLYRVPPVV
jgi:aspartyl-tRNA(Asn)/glutamyl-tRNA(Gln) amidotransferase subunit C